MKGLVRAEWLRFSRRPEILVASLLVLVLAAAGFVAGFLGDDAHLIINPGAEVPPDVFTQQAELRAPYAIPRSVVTVLEGAGPLAYLAALLGAGITGSEFAWGTLRTALIANHRRRAFGLVRAGTLGVLSLLLAGFLVLVALIAPVVIAITGTSLPNIAIGVPAVVATLAASIASLWFAAMIGMLCTLLVRSLQSGVIMSLVALAAIEAIGGALRANGASMLSELVPGQGFRLLAQLGRASAIAVDPIPTVLPTIVIVGCAIGWMLVLAASCIELIARRDVLI